MADPQVETLQRITRVETKIDNIEEKLDSAINGRELAVEAMSSAKSAHKRLDKLEKLVTWAATTIIGALILAIIGFIVKGGLTGN